MLKEQDKVVINNFKELGELDTLHDGDSPLSVGHKGIITDVDNDECYGWIFEVDREWWFFEGNLSKWAIVPEELFNL